MVVFQSALMFQAVNCHQYPKKSISDKVVVELDNEGPTEGKDNELVIV
jgi:hypothetical protein